MEAQPVHVNSNLEPIDLKRPAEEVVITLQQNQGSLTEFMKTASGTFSSERSDLITNAVNEYNNQEQMLTSEIKKTSDESYTDPKKLSIREVILALDLDAQEMEKHPKDTILGFPPP